MLGPQFTDELRSALSHRSMERGLRLLTEAQSQIATVGLNTPGGAELVLLISQWVDVGFRDYRLIEALLEAFPKHCCAKLPLEQYLCLHLAEAFRDLAASELDSAVDKLDWVLRTYRGVPNASREALAHFWKGRAHRKKGEYETALKHNVKACVLTFVE